MDKNLKNLDFFISIPSLLIREVLTCFGVYNVFACYMRINAILSNTTKSPFHPCFTRVFLVQNFATKNYNAVFWVCNFLALKFCAINVHIKR